MTQLSTLNASEVAAVNQAATELATKLFNTLATGVRTARFFKENGGVLSFNYESTSGDGDDKKLECLIMMLVDKVKWSETPVGSSEEEFRNKIFADLQEALLKGKGVSTRPVTIKLDGAAVDFYYFSVMAGFHNA